MSSTLVFTCESPRLYSAQDATHRYVAEWNATFDAWDVTVLDRNGTVVDREGGTGLLDVAKDILTAYARLGDDYANQAPEGMGRMTMAVLIAYGMGPIVVDVLLALGDQGESA